MADSAHWLKRAPGLVPLLLCWLMGTCVLACNAFNPALLDSDAGADGGNGTDGGSDAWWNAAYAHRIPLDLDTSILSESLHDVPVLVVLTPNRFQYTHALPAGRDLSFVDQDGSTVLAHEIEQWGANANSYLWVRVPVLSAQSETHRLWLYYGSANEAVVATDVWSNYHAVYHLNGDASDSGEGAFHGTLMGGASTNPGVVAGALSLDGAGGYVDLGADRPHFQAVSEGTVSMALYPRVAAPNAVLIGVAINYSEPTNSSRVQLARRSNGSIEAGARALDSEGSLQYLNTATGLIPPEQWSVMHLVFSYPAAQMTLYVNGVEVARTDADFQGQEQTANTPSTNGAIGADDSGNSLYFDGLIDEVRLAHRAHSAEWIALQSRSINDTLIAYHPTEARGQDR